jgi:hypothetical protein
MIGEAMDGLVSSLTPEQSSKFNKNWKKFNAELRGFFHDIRIYYRMLRQLLQWYLPRALIGLNNITSRFKC